MTVKDIVIIYLRENGFDGLCNENCGCGIDDFCPFDDYTFDCKPAYKRHSSQCLKCDNYCNCAPEEDVEIYCSRKPEGSDG